MNYPLISKCNPLECISGKINRANRMVSSVFRKHLKPFELTESQLSMLFMITKTGGISQKDLSQKLFMDKSTVNRNIERLLKNKLLTKIDLHIVQTTSKGKQLLERVIPAWDNAMKEIRTILGSEGENALTTFHNKLKQ